MKCVIIGNGVAGTNAARTISAAGLAAQIDVYTDEKYPFYLRPRLIDFLAGRLNLEDIYAHPPEWYLERGIIVHQGTRATGLDIPGRRILLEDGDETSYDRLLLATGSSPFTPALEGMEREGFFTLRSIDDALAIKNHAAECLSRDLAEAVVIGGGLLGLESANVLKSLGFQVTVVHREPWLLEKQLDQAAASMVQGQIERLGINFLLNAVGERMFGDAKVSAVSLRDGRTIPAHLVLCCAGVRPNTHLARRAGLNINRGILVDEQMRTSAEQVYAAGDVAEHEGQSPCIIPIAIEQARVAAANMLQPGSSTYHAIAPSTTLKIGDLDLTSIGSVVAQDEADLEISRVDGAKGIYRKLVLRDGRIVGAILLGDRKRVAPVSRLIKRGTDVSPYTDRLLDDDLDLRTIPT